MNDQTPIAEETGTAIALPAPKVLETILKDTTATTALLAKITAAGDSEFGGLTPDTEKGRKALIALSAKASSTKAEATRQAKALTEQWRKDTASVNAGRKILEDGLAAARDKWRAPVSEWEAAQEARKERHRKALEAFAPERTEWSMASVDIAAIIAEVEAIVPDDSWDEFQDMAATARENALKKFEADRSMAQKREEQESELARLRAEKIEREEADRIRAEAEAKAAEEKAAAERAEAESARKKAEEEQRQNDLAESLEKHMREAANGFIGGQPQAAGILQYELEKKVLPEIARTGPHADRLEAIRSKLAAKVTADLEAARQKREAEAAERARQEALEKAEREAKEAEERHVRELAAAKKREEEAVERERLRMAAARKAEADEKARREADQAHRQRIRDDIATSMNGFTDETTAYAIADAIMADAIPHVSARF